MNSDNQGHYIFGVVKVGERGQIVIPKDARDVFNIKPGDDLIIIGDIKKGIAIPTAPDDLKKYFFSLNEEK